MASIKNIIFDLGGVLLNLDYHKTRNAFKDLGIDNFDEMFTQFSANEFFENLETGKIKEPEFYATIKKTIPISVSDQQVADAWNEMMLDFRTETLPFLEELARKYKLYLLSNTNVIHLKYFQEIFTRDTGKPLLDDYFTKAYYSHLVGLRKPHKAIYEHVLKEENLDPAETLFIDDSIQNIEAARELGIKTHLLLPEESIEMIHYD